MTFSFGKMTNGGGGGHTRQFCPKKKREQIAEVCESLTKSVKIEKKKTFGDERTMSVDQLPQLEANYFVTSEVFAV